MLPTSLIWVLLVAANLVSYWGAIRWKGQAAARGRRWGLAAIGIGSVLELAAILLLILRYGRRI